jgi:hypothetical protein
VGPLTLGPCRALSIQVVPSIPFVSTVTGRVETSLDADYWCRNVRQPVLLQQAIEAFYQGGVAAPDMFVEVREARPEKRGIRRVNVEWGGVVVLGLVLGRSAQDAGGACGPDAAEAGAGGRRPADPQAGRRLRPPLPSGHRRVSQHFLHEWLGLGLSFVRGTRLPAESGESLTLD